MGKTRNPDALIRIEDAIKVLCRETCHPGMLCPDNHCAEMWDEFEDVERIDAAPVRHGRWIYHIDDLFPAESTQECDQCHEEQPLTCDDDFCPHCGAKMDGKGGDNHG